MSLKSLEHTQSHSLKDSRMEKLRRSKSFNQRSPVQNPEVLNHYGHYELFYSAVTSFKGNTDTQILARLRCSIINKLWHHCV